MANWLAAVAATVGIIVGGATGAEAAPLAGPHGVATVHLPGFVRVAAGERKYLVVLGSFKKKADAEKRCKSFAEARVVRTNEYAAFKPGLYACVVGPFSQALADEVLADYGHDVADAYVKAGW
ncbi:MAG TPA: SPOR domain-containing protein [Hyphomicrobiales bacterium]|nr:SPOR domain-containing protein [Kaistiaceae bacterium]HQF30487.1 SPOR domain-containing protein [Hyphomicrobiales bacterium]